MLHAALREVWKICAYGDERPSEVPSEGLRCLFLSYYHFLMKMWLFLFLNEKRKFKKKSELKNCLFKKAKPIMLEQHGLDSPYSNGSGPKSSFFKTFPNLHVFASREITYLASGLILKVPNIPGVP